MRQTVDRVLSLVITVALAAATAAFAIGDRRYGWTIFVSIPFFLGFFPAALLRISGPKPWRECLRLTIGTVLVLSLGFLVFRLEGLICLVLSVPLALPVAGRAMLPRAPRPNTSSTSSTYAAAFPSGPIVLLTVVGVAGVVEPAVDVDPVGAGTALVADFFTRGSANRLSHAASKSGEF